MCIVGCVDSAVQTNRRHSKHTFVSMAALCPSHSSKSRNLPIGRYWIPYDNRISQSKEPTAHLGRQSSNRTRMKQPFLRDQPSAESEMKALNLGPEVWQGVASPVLSHALWDGGRWVWDNDEIWNQRTQRTTHSGVTLSPMNFIWSHLALNPAVWPIALVTAQDTNTKARSGCSGTRGPS